MTGKTLAAPEALAAAGFTHLSLAEKTRLELRARVAIASEHYATLMVDAVDRFREKLRKESFARDGRTERWLTLKAYSLQHFPGDTPPVEVLEKLAEAQARDLFDGFQVFAIAEERREIPRPDPILYGYIHNCDRVFVIAQWGNDVTVEQIESA